jgi:hypothetical protein
MDRNELMILALQQRIGELTSAYEAKIALLRADITILTEEKEMKEKD